MIIHYQLPVLTFFVTRIEILELIGSNKDDYKSTWVNPIDLYNQIDAARGTVLLSFRSWTPKQVKKLEFQAKNYKGLFFIYNHIIKEIAENNKK